MARATAHSDHRCVSSNDVQGTEVYGMDGKHIGEVDHLIIDKMLGRVGPVGRPVLRHPAWWLQNEHH